MRAPDDNHDAGDVAALSGAAGDGARSGGIERDAAPTEPPTIVAGAFGGAAENVAGVDDAGAAVTADAAGDDVGAAELLPAALVDAAQLEPGAPNDPAALAYLANLRSAHSRRAMRGCLDRMAQMLSGGRRNGLTLAWGQLRALHTQAVRAALVARGYAPATANQHLTALRGVLHRAWLLGLIPSDDYNRAVELEPIRGQRIPPGRALPARELEKMFEACARDRRPPGRRDAALLAVLYQAGLRCCEAIALQMGDYDPSTGALRVMGKGNKQDVVYLDDGGCRALDAWLLVRGAEPGPIFCRMARWRKMHPRLGLTARAVAYIVVERATAGGVVDVSPHDLRRSLISDLLDDGVDLAAVQRVARHASPATTARYDRRGERTKREAARRVRVPFVEPSK